MRTLVVLAIVVGSGGLAAGEEDPGKADKIFEAAQKLKEQGKTAEACKMYEEALTYNRSAVGTLLNVALCHEQAGRYATAVKFYTQAHDLAREHSLEEHRKAAEERLAAASPLVAHLAIAFAETAPNMKLVIDEEVISVDKTDDIVLDPGSHHIVVTAPGRVPWETTVQVEKSKAKAIAVPKLGYPVTVRKGRRTVGMVMTGIGAAATLTGIGLGFFAFRKYDAQIGDMTMGANCSDTKPPMCNAKGYTETNDAITIATFGTYIGVAGVAIAGAGVYLWLFGPKPTGERNVVVVPTLAPESAGLSAIGRF